MTPRRALAAVALGAIVAAWILPVDALRLFSDRDANRIMSVPLPDFQWPQYPRFLAAVRARTAPGDSIAIVMPASAPREMYPLVYYRAAYFLTGREALPVIDPRTGQAIASNASSARYVAVFGESPAAGELVWKGEGGALYRR
jgi:hypothetical protein